MDLSEHSFLSIFLTPSNFCFSQNWEEFDLGLMRILLKLLKNTLLISALFTEDTFFSQPNVQTYAMILALALHSVAHATTILFLLISPSNPVSLSISLIY